MKLRRKLLTLALVVALLLTTQPVHANDKAFVIRLTSGTFTVGKDHWAAGQCVNFQPGTPTGTGLLHLTNVSGKPAEQRTVDDRLIRKFYRWQLVAHGTSTKGGGTITLNLCGELGPAGGLGAACERHATKNGQGKLSAHGRTYLISDFTWDSVNPGVGRYTFGVTGGNWNIANPGFKQRGQGGKILKGSIQVNDPPGCDEPKGPAGAGGAKVFDVLEGLVEFIAVP